MLSVFIDLPKYIKSLEKHFIQNYDVVNEQKTNELIKIFSPITVQILW